MIIFYLFLIRLDFNMKAKEWSKIKIFWSMAGGLQTKQGLVSQEQHSFRFLIFSSLFPLLPSLFLHSTPTFTLSLTQITKHFLKSPLNGINHTRSF